MPDDRTIGQIRDDENYGVGDSPPTRARKFLYGMKSDENYMKEATDETVRILKREGQAKVDRAASVADRPNAAKWYKTKGKMSAKKVATKRATTKSR